MKQHTLKHTHVFTGTGLHTGRPVMMAVQPAPADTGIRFIRTDIRRNPEIPAMARFVGKTRRSTSLKIGRARVVTPEHLLSTLSCMGIDNALILLDAPEVPILDGSASRYAEAFAADGLVEQDRERDFLVVDRTFVCEDPDSGSRIVIEPYDGFQVELTIDFKSKVIGRQTVRYDPSVDFAHEIAPCRTFCFYNEVRLLRFTGLIKGGSLDNALVVDDARGGFVGDPKLLFPDEPARHKLLDLLGDFSLAGRPVRARVTAYKPGHSINTKAIKQLTAAYTK